jgi:hypothetical protein
VLDSCTIDSNGNKERLANVYCEAIPAQIVIRNCAGFSYAPRYVRCTPLATIRTPDYTPHPLRALHQAHHHVLYLPSACIKPTVDMHGIGCRDRPSTCIVSTVSMCCIGRRHTLYQPTACIE